MSEAKDFASRLAQAVAQSDPAHFTAVVSKARRKGRIFVDYLRNCRGATAMMPYSARTRAGAPAAAPITWAEMKPSMGLRISMSAMLPNGRNERIPGLWGAGGALTNPCHTCSARGRRTTHGRFSNAAPPPARILWNLPRPAPFA